MKLLDTTSGILLTVLLTASVWAQLPPVVHPAENPFSEAKARLGKALFWDEQMSSTGTVACGTCHMPEFGGGDPRTGQATHPGADGRFGTSDDISGSPGVIAHSVNGSFVKVASFGVSPQVTRRRVQSNLMSAYQSLQFWDGRASGQFRDPVTQQVVIAAGGSLESQAAGPPVNSVEMAHIGATWPSIVARLTTARPLALATDVPTTLANWIGNRSYPALFAEAFGTAEVTASRICMALATYQRTLVPNQAPIDAFLAGDQSALSPVEQRGFQVFNRAAGCAGCHPSPQFQRDDFFNIGLTPIHEDRGRAEVTNNPLHEGQFKAPSLRNIVLRGPYFHTGQFGKLSDVMDFYARGGDHHINQSERMRPFFIDSSDRNAVLAFITRGLTDPRLAQALPPFDHPKLFSQSQRVPASYGSGAPGSDNIPPRLLAMEPPVLGNPRFTIGIADGLGGAYAALLVDLAPDTIGRRLFSVPIQVALSPAATLFELGPLQDNGAGAGFASRPWTVPSDPSMAGLTVYTQGLVIDPGAVEYMAATHGQKFTLFAPR